MLQRVGPVGAGTRTLLASKVGATTDTLHRSSVRQRAVRYATSSTTPSRSWRSSSHPGVAATPSLDCPWAHVANSWPAVVPS